MARRIQRILLLYTDKYYLVKQVYPFGLDVIADYLRRHGFQVDVEYPFLPGDDSEENLREILDRTGPDLVGLGIRNLDTCMSCEMYGDFEGQDFKTLFFLPHVRELVGHIRSLRPELPMIAGGGGFTVSPGAVLDYLGLDFGVAGEGEEPMRLFAEAWPDPGALSAIPGLVWRDGDGIIANPRGAYAFTAPAGGIARDPKFIHGFPSAGLPVQVKRGCNQGCSYCVEPLIEGRRFIHKDVGLVLEELRSVADLQSGAGKIFFVDTEFNIPNLEYATALARGIVETGLNEHFRFASQFLPRPFNADFARLLARAGFAVVLTCDSFSDAVLAENGVSYREADALRTLDACLDNGLDCTVNLVFGLPGETWDTLDHTITRMNQYRQQPGRQYEYTVGGRVFLGTPLCRRVEKLLARDGAAPQLYGRPTPGWLEPAFYCSPDSPARVKDYVDRHWDHPIEFANRYRDSARRVLAVDYLSDAGRLDEAGDMFPVLDLDGKAACYDHLFRACAGAGRADVAYSASVDFMNALMAAGESSPHFGQLGLVQFYMSHIQGAE